MSGYLRRGIIPRDQVSVNGSELAHPDLGFKINPFVVP